MIDLSYGLGHKVLDVDELNCTAGVRGSGMLVRPAADKAFFAFQCDSAEM